MSLFLKLVAAASEQGSTASILRDVKPTFLLESELPTYEFVVRHIRTHGTVPTAQTIVAAGLPTADAVEPVSYYAERIRQRFIYNVINERHPQLVDAMRDRNTDDAIATIRDILQEVGQAGSREMYSTLVAEVQGVVEEFDARRLQGGIAGVSTGWPSLDEMTQGMMGGDVIVIAGRPSMGKSWMLNEIGYKAWRSGKSVAAVSMEMGKRQFVRRWMGRHLGINPNFIRSGQLSQWTERSLRNYAEDVLSLPSLFVVSGDMEKHVEGLESFVAETSPDLILVDAAYLLTVEGRRKGGIAKWEMIGEVIGALKKMAIRHDRPVVITVQFNRNQKSSSSKSLDLGDIAGSDSIPQDASIVIGVRRGQPPFETVRRKIEVMKNREGSIGDFETKFSFTPPNMEEISVDTPAPDVSLSGWMV